MKNKLTGTQRRMLLGTVAKSILAMLGWLLFGLALLAIGTIVYRLFSFQGDEPLYQLAQFIQWNESAIAIIYMLAGMVGILCFFFRKPYLQLQEIMEGAKQVYTGEASQIELSPELKEFALELTEIKLKLHQNERAAKEAEQRKNDLIVYLAHDLKTPLTSVIGYLSLLTEEKEISKELQEKYLGITLDKAERLEELINDFFEITRFNLTTLVLEKENINLTRMMEQLVFEFQPMLQEAHLTASIDCPPDLMYTCDPDKMQRVFDNLLRNAVNYSYADTDIHISVVEKDEQLSIVFENHGRTIIPEKLAHIFEQFFRLDSSRATNSGGAGLGLAIAKEIIELHGGTIEAESDDERIVFFIRLPI